METSIEKGYLVIGDISGYTEFLAGSELDHAPNILRAILDLMVDQLTPTMQLAEVEGDAVFVYAPQTKFTRGELLLELIESTYTAFKDRQRTVVHNATCPCKACRSINNLDLKFVAHSGEFALQSFSASTKPVGTDVNLVHRLLKNNVSKQTGWTGYALFTKSCIEMMGLQPDNLHHSSESYDHLGIVETASYDLNESYRNYCTNRTFVLDKTDADVCIEYDFSAPPPVIWDWLNDPHKRNIWSKGAAWEPVTRPNGRTGRYAQNHCTASKTLEQIIDWQPFKYYTVRYVRNPLDFQITGELQPKNGGTHLVWRLKLNGSLPRWLLKRISHFIVEHLTKMKIGFSILEEVSLEKNSTSMVNMLAA